MYEAHELKCTDYNSTGIVMSRALSSASSIESVTIDGHQSVFGWIGDEVPTVGGLKSALRGRDDRIEKLERELREIRLALREHGIMKEQVDTLTTEMSAIKETVDVVLEDVEDIKHIIVKCTTKN